MLGTDELNTALTSATYKPGYRLVVRDVPHQGPYLTVRVFAPDANHRDEGPIELHIHSPIPPMRSRMEFYDWIVWRLSVIETHEVLEWFRVDGQPWYDPHTALDTLGQDA